MHVIEVYTSTSAFTCVSAINAFCTPSSINLNGCQRNSLCDRHLPLRAPLSFVYSCTQSLPREREGEKKTGRNFTRASAIELTAACSSRQILIRGRDKYTPPPTLFRIVWDQGIKA
ncbi:hypothetical protein CEXT_427781 [Caerostris extrusa]|uniref:Uncharacterized protein n=1 Tax=Caerostris extrusa TaxID=172846 RepID=A0AAV4NBC4_CAEEX|nr:hypothetical protein CEXT_427781 [Caerostris extrusa]